MLKKVLFVLASNVYAKDAVLSGPLPDLDDTAYIPEKVLKKGDQCYYDIQCSSKCCDRNKKSKRDKDAKPKNPPPRKL